MIATAPAIDPNKNWVFHFGSLVKNGISIKMEDRNGVVCFSIPFDGLRKINFELFSINEEEKIIEGKYSLGASRIKDSVVFRILEEGKLLQGTPTGTLARQVWTISTKD